MRGWLVKRKSVQINPSASLIRFVFVYIRVLYILFNVYVQKDSGCIEQLKARLRQELKNKSTTLMFNEAYGGQHFQWSLGLLKIKEKSETLRQILCKNSLV